jgi:hypothetical protein
MPYQSPMVAGPSACIALDTPQAQRRDGQTVMVDLWMGKKYRRNATLFIPAMRVEDSVQVNHAPHGSIPCRPPRSQS